MNTSSKIIPMQHQQEAVDVIQNMQDNGIRTGQFIYPTGSGKTFIEAMTIANHIKKNNGAFGIYMVIAPRIMLADQLLEELASYLVNDNQIPLEIFSLHSGKVKAKGDLVKEWTRSTKNQLDFEGEGFTEKQMVALTQLNQRKIIEKFPHMKYSNIAGGTSVNDLVEAINRAKGGNNFARVNSSKPLIVFSTYHSGENIVAACERTNTNIEILICDEAHNALAKEFDYVHYITQAKNRYYFTATQRITRGEGGRGMQNEELFGKRMGEMSPAEAVNRGIIVRPRCHVVGINEMMPEQMHRDCEETAKIDIASIEEAFKHHAKMVNFGAKMLVSARGVKNIKMIVEGSNYFENLRTSMNVKIFSIASAANMTRINGQIVERSEFMHEMKKMNDDQHAIIIHYDILSEGIDVPGITGIMPLRPLNLSKFLQTLGRATRKHKLDKSNPDLKTDAKLFPNWMNDYIKPFAWVIIPYYGALAEDICESIKMYVALLRTFGWIPSEGVFYSEAGGITEPRQMDTMFEEDEDVPAVLTAILDIYHGIEHEEDTMMKNETTMVNLRNFDFDSFLEEFV